MRLVVAVLLLLYAGAVGADVVISRNVTPVEGVSGKCSLETKADNQSLAFACEFSNAGKEVIRFLFCAMADLTDAKKEKLLEDGNREFKPIAGATDYVLKQEGGETGVLKCEKVNAKTAPESSVYFGCQLITLQPGAKDQKVSFGRVTSYKLVTQKPGGGDEKQVPFNTLKASDFTVVYTDQVNLTTTPKKTFDAKSCAGTQGQGNFIFYDTQSIAEGVRSQWTFADKSFVDPFVVYQPITPVTQPLDCDTNGDGFIDIADVQAIFAARNALAVPGDPRDPDHDGRVTVNDARICTLRITKQYASYDTPPCVPTGFPAKVPDLPACPLRANPPPPTTVDLNLFTWYTEIQPSGMLFPATLSVATEGNVSGLRIQTDPPAGAAFDLVGGVEIYGRLSICAASSLTVCLTPQVEEGRELDVTVNVMTDDEDGDNPPFLQSGHFTQDTAPPIVLSHFANFDSNNNLIVEVTAIDATTSPVHADFWFSIDAGTTWQQVALDPTSDILEQMSTRTFTGSIGPFATGQAIRYFIGVEDMVSNVTFFGVSHLLP
jgi:hypothetical protein